MKVVKFALLGFGILLLLIGALVTYIAATFNPNDYKPQIIQAVKDKKNRTLKLDGDIRLSFWPNIGVELGTASLSEFKSDKEFAAVGNLRVSVKLMPLFSNQMVVDEVTVKGARAAIVRRKDGSMNIDDLLAKDDKAETQQVAFDIAQVAIEDSAFSFRDEAKGAQYSLSKVNLKSGRIANNVPTKIDLSATIQSNQPKLNLATVLKTRLTFDIDKQLYVLQDMDLEAKGDAADLSNVALKATGSLTAKPATNEFTTEKLLVSVTGASGKDSLDVKVDAPKLVLTADRAAGEKVTLVYKTTGPQRSLNANVNLPGIEGTAKAFKARAMTADVDLKQGDLSVKVKLASPLSGNMDTQQVSLPDLTTSITASGPDIPGKSLTGELNGSAAVDGSKQIAQAHIAGKIADSSIKGRVGIAEFAAPAITFDLEVDQLDVDRYFPPAPAGQKQPEKPFDLSGLRELRANGTLRVGALKANNLKASNVRLDVKSSAGRVDLNPLTANFYQGTLASAVSINAAPVTPAFTVKHNMTGVNVAPLLKDLADNDTLEGKGNVTLDVTTQGNTVSALKKALNGSAALKLADGAVKGIDIAGSIRNAKAKIGQLRGTQAQTQKADKAQKTDFSELTATFRIANGVAHNNDLSLKSPLLRVGGEGSVNIGADTLDYLVKATVVGTTKGQGGRDLTDLSGLTVPVRLTGPIDSPSYQLDFASMVTDVAKQKVEQRVTSELEKRLGGALGGTAAKGGTAPAAKPEAKADVKADPAKGGTGSRDAMRDAVKGIFGR